MRVIVAPMLDPRRCATLVEAWSRDHAPGVSVPPGSTTERVARDYKSREDHWPHPATSAGLTRRLATWIRLVDAPLAWRGLRSEGWRVGGYGPGGKFEPHRDDEGEVGAGRVASVVVALDDPATYWGGTLRFPEAGVEVRLPKGWAVAFPAGALHGVSPVRRGWRRVAVTFLCA